MKLRSLRNKWTCERSTADEQIGQVCQSLLRRADSCSGDNHHTILPSVSRTIDPKDRQTQAWIQPLTSSFAPLLWLSCTHLHPHSNAPADGMTQTTEAAGNYTTELDPRAAASLMRSGLRKHAQI